MAPPKMRAAVVRGRGRVEIAHLPVPEPGPGEARVRVGACGICGSDLHLFANGLFPPAQTPGHESAGWVDALGDGATGPPIGAKVAVEPMRSCGSCPSCGAGRYSICRESRLAGLHDPGGLAEYQLVPAERLHRVPEDLAAPVAALAEPMAVVTRALRRGALAPGQRVLVLGAGAVGLLAASAARALGAGEVWISARHPHQAARARALGVARVFDEAEATHAALDAMGREAPIDLVVETVGGRADTVEAAAAAVRPGGAVAVVGVFWDRLALDPMPLLLKEVTLAWSYCYGSDGGRSDFAEAITVLAAQRAALAPLVTHAASLDDVAKAFTDAADKRGGAVKVSVVP